MAYRQVLVPFILFLVLATGFSPTALVAESGSDVLVDSSQAKKTTKVQKKTPVLQKKKAVVQKKTPGLQPKDQTGLQISPEHADKFLIKDTELKLVEGSNEFERIRDEIVVYEAVPVTLQWSTKRTDVARARWEVKELTPGGGTVATGIDPGAPQPGSTRRVTIPTGSFLAPVGPNEDTKYQIRIVPLSASNAPVGLGSTSVHVTQLAVKNRPGITIFGDGAAFPSLELISIKENVRQIQNTQLYQTFADVKIQVTNRLSKRTDKMWLKVRDSALLFRQNSPPVDVPELNPGATMTADIRMDAILPPPKSQTPQSQQVREWHRLRRDRCGPELRGILDWRGSQSESPIDPHRDSLLPRQGWADYTKLPTSVPICADGQCVRLCDIEKSIRSQLDGKSVGYSFVIGANSPKFGGGGKARTAAEGTAVDFTETTLITVASVAKWITAIGAMRIIRQADGLAIADAIGPFLPDEWNVGNYFSNVTFQQLLGQQSGIMDYGNVTLDYAKLQSFFEQPVDNTWDAGCTGSGVKNPPNAVDPPPPMQRCYSNYNFAIFRILLPRVAGLPVDTNALTRPVTLANQYELLIRQNVFERVGQTGTGCRPRGAGPHAFAYKFPGDELGFDWGDVRLECGGAGWYVSAEDMAKVLFSLKEKDGRILVETATESQFDQMLNFGLGVDNWAPNNFLEKNGAWGRNGRLITTSAAIFGPVSGPRLVAVLFVNSDITGTAGSARAVLQNAYNNSLY
ncbi:MAG: serine hydrolase domain-containing protein [Thermoanaerobaculia bacterium]